MPDIQRNAGLYVNRHFRGARSANPAYRNVGFENFLIRLDHAPVQNRLRDQVQMLERLRKATGHRDNSASICRKSPTLRQTELKLSRRLKCTVKRSE